MCLVDADSVHILGKSIGSTATKQPSKRDRGTDLTAMKQTNKQTKKTIIEANILHQSKERKKKSYHQNELGANHSDDLNDEKELHKSNEDVGKKRGGTIE